MVMEIEEWLPLDEGEEGVDQKEHEETFRSNRNVLYFVSSSETTVIHMLG